MNRLIAQKRRYIIENMTTDLKMIDLIDEIFDDFESRTCENCVYFDRIGACSNNESIAYDCLSVDDFGCNKFERKEK